MYEDHSKSSVMNGFPYTRTMYAWLILCMNILHSFIHAHVKFRRESSKYQYSYWHLKWPQSYTLAYIWRWKGESIEFGDVNLHKKSCCDENFAPKRDGNKLLRIIQNICYFNAWLSICKWHKFGIKECYHKRGHVSYITEYRLLMWIPRFWNKDKNNVTYH